MFEQVYVYAGDGSFIGSTIKRQDAKKLNTMNLWTEDEDEDLRAQLQRLNDSIAIQAHWPSLNDPEVLDLLNNPAWEPVPLAPVEMVDEDNSTFVWIRRPNMEAGDIGELDEDSSVILLKTVMMPPPALVQARMRKAQEVVARKRMG
jgi:hypothetical protein